MSLERGIESADIIRPSEFMLSPLHPLERWFQGLAVQLQEDIEKLLKERFHNAYKLGIGTELEIVALSDEHDPVIHKRGKGLGNPNYTPEHLTNVWSLADEFIMNDTTRACLQDIAPYTVDKRLIELRTKPGDIHDYIEQIHIIRAYFQQHSAKHHLLPSLYSQHIHVSINDGEGDNLLSEPYVRDTLMTVAERTYRSATPLVLLPDEIVKGETLTPIALNSDKGRHEAKLTPNKTPGLRFEIRANSSEYAHEPSLNICLVLMAIMEGLQKVPAEDTLLSKMRKLKNALQATQIILGSYESELNRFFRNPLLKKYFPKEIVRLVHETVKDYPTSPRSSDELQKLRNNTREKAYGIDPDLMLT